MILGSLLLKRKETAVHGFVRRSFFIKWDTGRLRTPRYPEKEKIIPLVMPIAHAKGIYNLSAQPKRPLHKTMCNGLLLSCYVRCAR